MLIATFQEVFPKFFDFSEFTVINLIEILFTALLGFAAIFVSIRSYRTNKYYYNKGEETKKTEIKIGISKQLLEIYNFFIKEILVNDFFNFDNEQIVNERLKRLEDINCASSYIFDEPTYSIINQEIINLKKIFILKFFPSFTKEDYDKAIKSIYANLCIQTGQAGKDFEYVNKIVFLFSLRYDIEEVFKKHKLML